jgi:hypothetical protein
LFLLLLPVSYYRIENNLRGVIASDCEGYYKYLPTFFILGDMHKMPAGTVWPMYNDKGEYVDKYTSGVALMELPFFLGARAYCRWKGEDETDIFNVVFCWAMAFSGYFYGFLGLFFLKRALERYFSPLVTFWTLMSVFFGTNLFYYTTKELGMSHAYSFCLFAFMVWRIPIFYEKPDGKNTLLLGGALGWMTLIRPTNGLMAVFFLLYDVYSWPQWQARRLFWQQHWRLIPVGLAAGAVIFIPQMCYWKTMLGHWFVYSYQGETFKYWNAPKYLEVLFDVQNGLFTYTPMAFLMVAGLVMGWRVQAWQARVSTFLFLLITYLFASWWAWWFGGAFGHRCYVEWYAVLALPLAGWLQWVLALPHRGQRLAWMSLVVFFIYYSVRLSYLYVILGGPWDGPEWRWNPERLYWIWEHLFRNP